MGATSALAASARPAPDSLPGRVSAVASQEWFNPVLLAAAFLLPPAATALVAMPGALLGRVEPHLAAVRRVWHAAQLSLAASACSYAFAAGGGRRALAGPGALDFPRALFPAAAAASVFCLVVVALDGGVRVAVEQCAPRAAWVTPLPRALASYVVHAPAGLTAAVLWRSDYGPLAALPVLVPACTSACLFALYHRERAAHQATIRALVQAVDIKDRYTRGHSERVGRASVLIARELGMRGDRLEALRIAGILHDVGKLGVPTRVLRKNGPLTPEERKVIQLHPEYGHEVVRGIRFLGEARAAILHHHERMDGKGYPRGLAGYEIPEFARVVAVADAFDAMTSTRSYRSGRPVPAAVEELQRCAGSQFDPRMVGALTRALDRHGWHTAVTADEVVECGNVSPPGPPPSGAVRPGAVPVGSAPAAEPDAPVSGADGAVPDGPAAGASVLGGSGVDASVSDGSGAGAAEPAAEPTGPASPGSGAAASPGTAPAGRVSARSALVRVRSRRLRPGGRLTLPPDGRG